MNPPVPRSFVYCGPLMPRDPPKNNTSESNSLAFVTGLLSLISSSGTGGSLKSEPKILKIQDYNKCIASGLTEELCKEKYMK
jgi:hypothetical protein